MIKYIIGLVVIFVLIRGLWIERRYKLKQKVECPRGPCRLCELGDYGHNCPFITYDGYKNRTCKEDE